MVLFFCISRSEVEVERWKKVSLLRKKKKTESRRSKRKGSQKQEARGEVYGNCSDTKRQEKTRKWVLGYFLFFTFQKSMRIDWFGNRFTFTYQYNTGEHRE